MNNNTTSTNIKVGICYRQDAEGKGACWDHFTFQQMFSNITTFVLHYEENQESIVSDIAKIRNAAKNAVCDLRPIEHCGVQDVDVIVIPGFRKDYEKRKEFEEDILKQYYKIKPIILICGAVQRLKKLGVTMKDVSDHCVSQIVTLNQGAVQRNIQLHTVQIEENDTAKVIFENDIASFSVNSVHKFAIDSLGTLQDEMDIILRSSDVLPKPDGKQKEK